MKRRTFLRHLAANGCKMVREGGRHSIFWNPAVNTTTAIPCSAEIDDFLVKKICRDLGIGVP